MAHHLCRAVLGRYRPDAVDALWNLLDSHDTPRFVADAEGDLERLKLAALFQYTFSSSPCPYYGTELGMDRNAIDFRAGMDWEEARRGSELLEWFRGLGRMRRREPALRAGDFVEVLVDDAGGLYGFERRLADRRMLVVLNRTDASLSVALPFSGRDLLSGAAVAGPDLCVPPRSGRVVLRS